MKKWIVVGLLLVLGAAAGGWFWWNRPGEPKPKTCYLVIVLDSLRADHVSAYGYERPTTPIADELAKNGVLFEHPVAQAPWTKPSVASIFSSAYTSVHKVLHSKRTVNGKDVSDALSEKFVTLAEALKTGGFATAGYGMKLHLRPRFGFRQGFDDYDMEAGIAPDINKKVLRWLRREDPEKFFIYLHYNDPHYPFRPEDAWAKFGAKTDDVEHNITGATKRQFRAGELSWSTEAMDNIVSLYDAETLYNDHYVGKLLEGIAHRGYENVVVFYTADHGEEFMDHGDITHGHTLHDELIRVPLIVGGSGLDDAARGQRSNAHVQLIDIMPTILEMESLPLPPGAQGESFASFLRGKNGSIERNYSYSDLPLAETIYDGRFKLIRSRASEDQFLFDIKNDPLELSPIEAPEITERLRGVLESWNEVNRELYSQIRPEDSTPLDPEIEDRLRAIGYVD